MTGKRTKHRRSPVQRLLTWLCCAVMIAGIVYFAGQIKGEVQITFTLLTDINETKAEYDKVLAEKDQLTQQKEQLSNSDYVRTWARGEYLITKEGEEIYKLPAQTTGNGQ